MSGDPEAVTAIDMYEAHSKMADAAGVLLERRSLYRVAAQILGVKDELTDLVLDSPLVRHHLGDAMGGNLSLRGKSLPEMRGAIGDIVDIGLSVIAAPEAQDALSGLLSTVAPMQRMEFLTKKSDPTFAAVLDCLKQGIEIVRDSVGPLGSDLLAHVSLVGIVDSPDLGGFESGSSRYFPGIVLLKKPNTPIEAAEGLFHEGAHQKYFDFLITRDFLDDRSDFVANFMPSWSDAKWPIEQAYAAWHAYQCISELAQAEVRSPIGSSSLLSVAKKRSLELARWLKKHETYLLGDASWLLDVVCGFPRSLIPASDAEIELEYDSRDLYAMCSMVSNSDVLSTSRMVAGYAGSSPQLFLLDRDPALIMKVLGGKLDGMSAGDVLMCVEAEWKVDQVTAFDRFLVALDLLVKAKLVDLC